MTIGESCRTIARENVGKTLAWAIERAQEGMTLSDIKQHLALPRFLANFCKTPDIR